MSNYDDERPGIELPVAAFHCMLITSVRVFLRALGQEIRCRGLLPSRAPCENTIKNSPEQRAIQVDILPYDVARTFLTSNSSNLVVLSRWPGRLASTVPAPLYQ